MIKEHQQRLKETYFPKLAALEQRGVQ